MGHRPSCVPVHCADRMHMRMDEMPEAEQHMNMHMNEMAEPKRKKMRVKGGRAHWARDHDDD
eukprot:4113743-Prymnesium_polylepis.1